MAEFLTPHPYQLLNMIALAMLSQLKFPWGSFLQVILTLSPSSMTMTQRPPMETQHLLT